MKNNIEEQPDVSEDKVEEFGTKAEKKEDSIRGKYHYNVSKHKVRYIDTNS